MIKIDKINYRNKPRKKRSLIWKINLNDFIEIVKNSESFGEILRKCNIPAIGGNIHTLKKRLKEENIDYSHIPLGKCANKGRKFDVSCLEYDDLFVENCKHSRSALKHYIIKNNLIPYKCSICGNEGIWYNKKLVLVLDHINGIRNDNRIENLRFLCPNCNAQQETFAGRNNIHRVKNYCLDCGCEISKNSTRCNKCNNSLHHKTSKCPTIEQLSKDILEMNNTEIGKKYKVSEAAVRKWIKKLNLKR